MINDLADLKIKKMIDLMLRVYQDHKTDKTETLINLQSTLALTLRID